MVGYGLHKEGCDCYKCSPFKSKEVKMDGNLLRLAVLEGKVDKLVERVDEFEEKIDQLILTIDGIKEQQEEIIERLLNVSTPGRDWELEE